MLDSSEIRPDAPTRADVKYGRLKVVHLPVYGDNQYQPLLMKALSDRGLQVIDGGGGGDFLRTALFHWKADLYHFHWLHPYMLRRGRPASILRGLRFLLEVLLIRLSGARLIWTVHNLVNHERRFPEIERLYSTIFAHLADGVIAHSDSAGIEATRVHRLSPRTRIVVIPQGSYVDHYPNERRPDESRAKLSLSADEIVFLFLGRIEGYKGVLDLVRAFKQLPGKPSLLIAGRASDSDLLARLREEIGGAPRIRLDEGYVSDGELQTYFNAADVFVFPVRAILNSSSISLAMSFGLACVAPALDGIKAMLGDDGGIFYNPSDPRGLLTAMELAIERRSELPAIGRKNLERARETTWSTVAGRTESFYRTVMSGKPAMRVAQ